ncbi:MULTISPECIES: putative RiPP precursor [unclassified Mesorhizobium]|nr:MULTISPECIES: putative RiPP precursor [unclassified Mesorhizobium]MBZ9683887.1 putative RiPP precursor [Mesorhizobium sp. CO1-1-2]MBZ9699096.1 putative RiPP precursor [Mesorhizobium sp. CO1-1-9]MBZ9725384.1 putative RiPP precursor [Mesorhizobium sp. CO1-1-11]MBZ9923679.1 putative RiPP precursor [Mesorhizobium sp. BR1-1-4]
MKKTYDKPALTKRERLSAITALTASSITVTGPVD